ncbi:terminase small subunit [Chitinophaga sp. YIM B06452]|uniref:terminase small subunit n=1 Tax=Chitinophaga sp. YIM B06452 TaxID=3082158 RepID=UPI0031FEB88D
MKGKSEKKKPLNPRQKKLADTYLQTGSVKYSAEAAGYSKKNSESLGSRTLKKPHVQAYVQSQAEKLAEKVGITQERVLKEYVKLAFFDPRKLYDESGALLKAHDLDDDTAAAITGMEKEELHEGYGEERRQIGYTTKVKFSDKRQALDSIAKMMGWNAPEKKEVTGKDGAPLYPELDLSDLTDEELRVMAKLKRKLNAEHL